MSRPFLSLALAAAGAVALAGCSSSDPSPATTTVIIQQAPAPTVTVTQAAPSPAVPGAETSEPAAAAETFKMPKVVGMVLQDAQDLLQTKGSYLMDQQDATGLERIQVLDSNWQVCSQSPKAGRIVPIDTVVVLKSVKLTETCP